MTSGPFLGLEAAARYCGISRRSLSRHLSELEIYRIGSRVLLLPASLDRWMSLHRVAPKPMRKPADVGRIVAGLRRGAR